MKIDNIFRSGLILILLSLSCNSVSNQTNLNYYDLGGYTQGTTYRITFGTDEYKDLKPGIEAILDSINHSLSVYDTLSIISRINQNDATVVPDAYFIEVIEKSIQMMNISDGAFDITCAPLIDFWGFGAKKSSNKDTSEIREILKHVGVSKIKLIGNKFIKSSPQVKINVNAIAQGYTVDVISNFLVKNNILNYLVEIGGELRTRGLNEEGLPWKIGIDKPLENSDIREIQIVLKLSGESVSTSGNYRNYYIENGTKYAHTINPKTGFPAHNEMLSTTIIAKNCTEADAIATACMVLGYEKSLLLLKSFPGVEAYFICTGEKNQTEVFWTSGFNKYMDLN